ncbi:MAG: hypothetical protein V1803_01730 [Candidatus Roizmanbacteria bacterium]
MEGLNKIVSFILGLVVVIVFFAVVTGKINLKNIGKKSSLTTAVTTKSITPTPKVVSSIKINPTNHPYSSSSPSSIPSTGLPTLFIPTLLVGLFGGSKLRQAGKKD